MNDKLRPIPQAKEFEHGSRGELFEHISVRDPFQAFLPFWMQRPRYVGQQMTMTSQYRRGSAFMSWFIRSEYMQHREFGASSDMWIEDPERAERVDAAAAEGCDGSTHAEHIQDWREGFKSWLRDTKRNKFGTTDRFEAAVTLYLDELESWHEMNGTLWQVVN